MANTLCMITTILLTAFLYGCNAPHGNYSFIYNGRTYEVVKEKRTWDGAARYATEHGARLVEIDNAGEQLAVFNAIAHDASINPDYTVVKDGGGIAYVWIGATDQNHEGAWMWDGASTGKGSLFWNGEGANGKPVDSLYANWGGRATGRYNEPDNFENKQHAAAIGLSDWPQGIGNLGYKGEWNDIDESNKLYFVIEFDHIK